MLLKELLDDLTYGELANLAVGGGEQGCIAEKDYPKILSHLNLGLTALHRRLPIRHDEVLVQQYENIDTYYLRTPYAATSGSAESIKYLLDTVAKPFSGKVFKIETATGQDGTDYELNQGLLEIPIWVQKFDTLEMQCSTPEIVKIGFRGGHPDVLMSADFDPGNVEIDLPEQYRHALLCYIASRAYTPIVQDGETGGGNVFNKMFEYQCSLLKKENLGLDRLPESVNKFESRGFV